MDDQFDGESEEIFSQYNVILKKACASHIAELNGTGKLSFKNYSDSGIFCFEWVPLIDNNFEIYDTDSQESGWSLIDTIGRASYSVLNAADIENSRSFTASMSADVTDDRKSATNNSSSNSSLKSRILRVRANDLRGILVNKKDLKLIKKSDGISVHSSYTFVQDSAESFVKYLEGLHHLRKCSMQPNYYLFMEESEKEKLQKSFAELNIDDIRNSKLSRKNLLFNPYNLELLSKFANASQNLISRKEERPHHHIHEVLKEQNSLLCEINKDNLELPLSSAAMDCGDEEEIHQLPPRPVVERSNPLTEKQWREFRTPEGRISDPERVKEIIFHGGIEHSLRGEVWKYLLNYDVWDHSAEERADRRLKKTQEYYQMKCQWCMMSEKQENNFVGFRDRKCQIEKDVKRTDRALEFFSGDDNPNLIKLQDILMTFIMYNFDLGYVQGMNDLLAPILCLIQNEAECFWCFVGFMDIVYSNFDIDQAGMKKQLDNLKTLLSFANPKLYNYFTEHQSENMYFCFRWLLVWYKREFSNGDIISLWETLWTGLPCINFHLFIGLAVLDEEMDIFIDRNYQFTEILKHVNELSGKIDLKKILIKAEAIYLQIKSAPHLTDDIRVIIGESPIETATNLSEDEEEYSMHSPTERSPEESKQLQKKLEEACDLSMSYMFI